MFDSNCVVIDGFGYSMWRDGSTFPGVIGDFGFGSIPFPD